MSKFKHVKSALDVLATVAVLIAAGLFIWTILRAREAPMPVAGAGSPPVEDVEGQRLDATTVTNVVGKAPIALVEFADFQCPFCARHAQETYPRIKEELIDKGLLTYAFINFPLESIHPQAFKASEAAECAAKQQKYWQMHDRMFANPKALAVPDLLAHADALELDRTRFETCLGGEASEKVIADIAAGRRLGVTGTPAFFLGRIESNGNIELLRRINGVVPFETVKKEVDALREKQLASR